MHSEGVPENRSTSAERLRIVLNNPSACAEFCHILRNAVIVHLFAFDLELQNSAHAAGVLSTMRRRFCRCDGRVSGTHSLLNVYLYVREDIISSIYVVVLMFYHVHTRALLVVRSLVSLIRLD